MVDLKHLTQSPCTSWSLLPPGKEFWLFNQGSPQKLVWSSKRIWERQGLGPSAEAATSTLASALPPWPREGVPALLPSVSLLVVQLLRNHKLPWSTRNHRLHAMRTLALTHSALFPLPHRICRNHWCVSRSKLEPLPRGCGVFLAFLLQ